MAVASEAPSPRFDSDKEERLDSDESKFMEMESAKGILKPLMLPLNSEDYEKSSFAEFSSNHSIDCLLCSSTFNEVKDFKLHLNLDHKLIIAETRKIAYLRGYALFWKKIFAVQSYKEICSSFCVNSVSEEGKDLEPFYLLSDKIPEDQAIREKLKRLRLESVLKQHENERKEENFDRSCLYCTKQMAGDRELYFDHLANEHGLFLGHVNNIVYVHQLLDLLDEKLNKKFECLYCEKIFKDGSLVKEHMRKKQHRAINPKNQEYDKFYLINYLELDRKWEDIMKEDDNEIQEFEDDTEESWGGGWKDHEMNTICLFCKEISDDAERILLHMKEDHNFDLEKIKKMRNLNFYQQLKFVNYIRRQMFEKRCFSCLRLFENQHSLYLHLTVDKHIDFIPETKVFDQPQYYFPTYENDNLLCALFDDTPDSVMFKEVECEEYRRLPPDSILWNENILLQLKGLSSGIV